MAAEEQERLMAEIRRLGPWHHDIQLTEDVSTGLAFGAKRLPREKNRSVALISPRSRFQKRMREIYRDGLEGKTLLDCACNAGGYSFWARELGAARCFGFDVREHWIRQAEFVRQHRRVAPTDRIEFRQMDLLDLPQAGLEPHDITMFQGIFYHLPEPMSAVKMIAGLTREVMWFSSATYADSEGRSLYCKFEDSEALMSGVHTLSWMPTGPHVVAKILYWAGFRDIRLTFNRPTSETDPRRGRIEVLAAKQENFLAGLDNVRGVRRLFPETAIGRKKTQTALDR